MVFYVAPTPHVGTSKPHPSFPQVAVAVVMDVEVMIEVAALTRGFQHARSVNYAFIAVRNAHAPTPLPPTPLYHLLVCTHKHAKTFTKGPLCQKEHWKLEHRMQCKRWQQLKLDGGAPYVSYLPLPSKPYDAYAWSAGSAASSEEAHRLVSAAQELNL
jgi:hypothetical protein